MIARMWKARAAPDRATEYAAYLRSTVIPELAAIDGYVGMTLLERDRDDLVEVTVITWWQSIAAIRAFAGDAVETAVVHDTAARMLVDFDRAVTHHRVVVDE